MPRTLDGQSGSLNLWGKFGVKKKKTLLEGELEEWNSIYFCCNPQGQVYDPVL